MSEAESNNQTLSETVSGSEMANGQAQQHVSDKPDNRTTVGDIEASPRACGTQGCPYLVTMCAGCANTVMLCETGYIASRHRQKWPYRPGISTLARYNDVKGKQVVSLSDSQGAPCIRPARPRGLHVKAKIFAARIILICLDDDADAAAMHMWALQDETGIDGIAFESARQSARLAADAWRGREEQVRRRLRDRLAELMPA